jgi:hypothetical protein
VALDNADDVLLQRSRSPWWFSPGAYAQEVAFAHELAARGRTFAVTDRPDLLVGKSVVWFMPEQLIEPRLWNYSRQVHEFACGLESQGNRLFCSASETAYWENKAHMHRRLAEIGAPTPKTRILSAADWEAADFDIEPVLIKQEHSAGSAGLFHFSTAEEARAFVSRYDFRPQESLIMQEVVPGATRDLRVTMAGNKAIGSATYWRTKAPEAVASSTWTSTATSYGSAVEHEGIPDAAESFCAKILAKLGVRTAGVDLIWTNDDLSQDPLILEFSPYYQPNPPIPARYANLTYKEFKNDWAAEEGYLASQYLTFREIASAILDQDLF